MGLARPKTKAQQATRSTSSEQAATRHEHAGEAITLADALDRWYTSLRAGTSVKSERTIAAYRYGTDKLLAHVGATRSVQAVQAEDIEALLAALKARGLSDGGRAVVYRPVKSFFRWAVKRGLVTKSPVEDVVAPRPAAKPIAFVTEEEWAAILATTITRSRWAFRAWRDRAILLMLATTGARLSEVATLRLSDVDVVARTILVKGKGDKDRVLPLLDDAYAALDVYLKDHRPRSPFASTTDALWLASRGPLTSNGVAQMVAERGRDAGVKRRVHPHELRHRAIAGWLRAGMPQPLVMALSGHSTPAMLTRYGAHTRQEDAMAFLRGLGAA
jgi:site-specific recombinase XerD